MGRITCAVLLVLSGCGSSSADGMSPVSAGGSSAGAACPDVSGAWKITEHCDPSLVGTKLDITQASCDLSFAGPFYGFSAHVAADGKVTLTGPQSCTGSATTSAIALNCTPGTCKVTLAR